jgi:GT2 family glycosyltransferase
MKTSIVMLTYNKLEFTRQCIESIRAFTQATSCETIVVDNHSTNGTVEWLREQHDLRVIENSENRGFPEGINWNILNAVMASVPGFEKVATGLMKKTVKNSGVASIEELRGLCIEAGVNLVACQMTVDLSG